MPISRRHLAAGALALAATLPLAAQAESSEEAGVRKAVDDLTKAMLAADKAALEALVSDQLSYGHSAGAIQDKADFVAVIASKKTVYQFIGLTDIKVAIAGNNAIVRHTWDSVSLSGGKTNASHIGVLQVWVKEGAAWKLLGRQAFKT